MTKRPVQFVFAGKAHPQDEGSKRTLQLLGRWKYDARVRQRLCFSRTTIRISRDTCPVCRRLVERASAALEASEPAEKRLHKRGLNLRYSMAVA